MEKLCELRTQRDYPLIVLDTPPTAHALDFLDAPNRILDFLDNDAAKWLLTPGAGRGQVRPQALQPRRQLRRQDDRAASPAPRRCRSSPTSC